MIRMISSGWQSCRSRRNHITTIDTFEDGASQGLQDRHIEAFLEHLRAAGYAKRTFRKKLSFVAAFARWLRSKTIALNHLGESDIAAFVRRSPGARTTGVRFELAALLLLLENLRAKTELQLPAPDDESVVDNIKNHYVDYLRQYRGLAENSVSAYAPIIRNFLNSQNVGGCQLVAGYLSARNLSGSHNS